MNVALIAHNAVTFLPPFHGMTGDSLQHFKIIFIKTTISWLPMIYMYSTFISEAYTHKNSPFPLFQILLNNSAI